MTITRILTTPLSLDALLAETEDDGSGALIIFAGTVRNQNEGQPVAGMTYEAHTELAEKTLAEIEAEAIAQFGARHCRIQHRIGRLALGEASVLVVVRAAHRAQAYEASRYAIDQLKGRAAIWKEEHYIGGQSKYLEGVPLVEPE
jgi:molybdopterin synthase catalytic subunit